jgi:hypothetical protein
MSDKPVMPSLGSEAATKRAIEVINIIHSKIDELQVSVDAKYLAMVLLYRSAELFRALLHHKVYTEEEVGHMVGSFLNVLSAPLDASEAPKIVSVATAMTGNSKH